MKMTAFDTRFIIFPLIFLLIYIFAAASPLGNDLYFKPVWACTITQDSAQTELEGLGTEPKEFYVQAAQFAGNDPKVFLTKNRFGYFTAAGELLRSSPIIQRVSASSAAWTAYGNSAVRTPIYRPDGSLLMTIEEEGFVYIDEDRFYLFEPGGSAVKRYGSNGKPMWRYQYTAPITAFHSTKGGTVIGFSDGKLVCLDPEGMVRCDFYPGGSDYQIILGAALSADGTLATCVCGINRQRVILAQIGSNTHKIIHHQYLTGNLRRRAFVNFDESGKNVVFECAEGIGLIDCLHLSSGIIPQQGRIHASGHVPHKGITALISQHENTSILSFIEAPAYIIGKTAFPSKHSFLLQEGDKLFVATDTKLACMSINGIE